MVGRELEVPTAYYNEGHLIMAAVKLSYWITMRYRVTLSLFIMIDVYDLLGRDRMYSFKLRIFQNLAPSRNPEFL